MLVLVGAKGADELEILLAGRSDSARRRRAGDRLVTHSILLEDVSPSSESAT